MFIFLKLQSSVRHNMVYQINKLPMQPKGFFLCSPHFVHGSPWYLVCSIRNIFQKIVINISLFLHNLDYFLLFMHKLCLN